MRRLLFLPLVLAVFAGCGTTETTNQRSAPAAVAAAKAPDSSATPLADRVIASRWSRIGISPVGLEIVQLHREGTTTSLGLRLKSHATLGPYVADWFDDGTTQPVQESDSRENGSSLDGIYLIDRAHGTKYLVARDADNRCLCDSNLLHTRLTDLGPIHLSATFGAPPGDVQAVDVFVPVFGTFTDVPLG
jgi:hypothetical protein